MDYLLLPKTAKHLNHKRDGYRYLIDGDGVEWLVEIVKDNGRYILLYKAGSEGKIVKYLWSDTFEQYGPDPFKNYRIVGESLNDEQEAAIKDVLKITGETKRKELKAMAEPKCQLIKVADLIPTPDNPRIVRTESESFKTLADSVKAEGVRIPVIVRAHPKKKGKYDLRAGARRLAAAKLAKLKTIPCLVYEDLSDEEAFDLTFLENFAHENLTVLEEAHAVATLLEKNAGDVKAVADKFDRSEKWIRLRANVHGNLSNKWLECIGNIGNKDMDWDDTELTNCIAHFGIGHFALIARFDKATQDHILDDAICEEMTVDDLDKACSELLMDLSTATWDINSVIDQDDGEGDLSACWICHKRTGHQSLLWDDDPKKGKVDRCLDPACWEDHIAAAMAEKMATAKEKHENLKLLTTEQGYTENKEIASRLGDLLESSDVSTAQKGDKDAFPCFVVRGKQAGKIVWKKKAGVRTNLSQSKPKGPTPLRARRKILTSKRWYQILAVVRRDICEMTIAQIQHEDKQLAVMGLVAHIGSKFNDNGYGWTDFADAIAKGRDYVLGTLWLAVLEHLDDEIRYNSPITQLPDSYIENAKQIMKLLGLKESEYWAEAVEKIPEPAGWAKLNENGTPKPVKKMKCKPKAKKTKK